MKTKATLLQLAIIVTGFSQSISGESIYVSQVGAGDGLSSFCPKSVAWFNTLDNWGAGAGKISAGDTVHLCGTITADLFFHAGGTPDNYIVLDGTGAIYSGCLYLTNLSWWKVQNVTWLSGNENHLISISGGSNGIFTRNHADNISGDPAVWLAQYNGISLPSNITISNNFIRTTTTNPGNKQLDIIKTEGSTNVTVEGNYLEMRAGGTGSNAHDDCIQTYEKGGSSGGAPENWTIRYNRIVMNSAAMNDRSWAMIEDLTGTNYIYGNVFLGLHGAEFANGLNCNNNGPGVVFNIFNNTFVSKNGASNNVLNLTGPGTANISNNIFNIDRQTALTGNMTVNRHHNLWYGRGAPVCAGYKGEICGKKPMFTDYNNNDFSLLPGSPAINAGSSPGALYNTYIDRGARWPGPALGARSLPGNWDIGAY